MKTVLCVDDDPDIRESVEEVLREEGFDVVLASDGFEALAALEHVLPDVLLLDWMMPSLNGLEVLTLLTARGQRCFPVLVMTASSAVIQVEVEGVLRKPFALEALVEAIRNVQQARGPDREEHPVRHDGLRL